MEKSLYRGYILVAYKLGKTATEIDQELKKAYLDDAPSYQTVRQWVNRFKAGSNDLKDFDRPGRPITAITATNIDSVRSLIDENPHISYKQIEAHLDLNVCSIHEIIHCHLFKRKIASRWVPHDLTIAQKQNRVDICKRNLAKFNTGKWRLCDIITGDESWVYLRAIGNKQSTKSWVDIGESPRTVVKRNRYEPKTLLTVFFRSTGVIFFDCLEKDETMSASRYRDEYLKPVMEKVIQQRTISGTKNMKILHDNAKPHVAKIVKSYLQDEKIMIIDHPPYSPDLAPSDFWLFDLIKKDLDSHSDVESLKFQITKVLENIPKEEYLKTFHKYLERMQMCIDNQGEYFEHLLK